MADNDLKVGQPIDPNSGYSLGKPAPQTAPTQNGLQVGQPLPEGYALTGTPPSNRAGDASNTVNPDFASPIAQAGYDTLKGAGKALESTIEGGGSLIRKLTGQPQVNDLNRPQLQTNSIPEKMGYGGETLLEFLAGDAVVGKAMSYADKLAQGAKVAKILESSPKLMKAVQLGADMLHKAHTAEGVASVLPNAVKSGVVQGAQTLARTGGDVKEAAKQGGIMAAVSAPLGLVGEGISALGGKLTEGAEASGNLTEAAKQYGDKASTADLAQDYVEKSKEELHKNYEAGVQDFKSRAGDTTIDPVKEDHLVSTENPEGRTALANQAENLLQQPIPSDNFIVNKVKGAIGETLDKKVKDVLETLSVGYKDPAQFKVWKAEQDGIKDGTLTEANGKIYKTSDYEKWQQSKDPNNNVVSISGKPQILNEPMSTEKLEEPERLEPHNIDQLIQLRQSIRRLAQGFEPGNVNSRTLIGKGSLTEGIDDTIKELASKAPDANLPSDYAELRKDYASKINIYDTPVVKKLRAGAYDDTAKALLSGNGAGLKTEQLRKILGDDRMDDFAHHVFGNMLQDSTDTSGQVNAAKLVRSWEKLPQEAKENLFNTSNAGANIASMMKDAKIARSIQYLTRVGVVSPLAIAGGQFTHLGLIGVLLAEGAAGRGAISKVGDVLDYVANHPNMWKSLKATGEAATGTAGANVGKAAAAVAGQTVSGANSNPRSFVPENPDKAKRNVYGSLSGTGLTGNEATHPGAR